MQSVDHPTVPVPAAHPLGVGHSRSASQPLLAAAAEMQTSRSSMATPVEHAVLLLEQSMPLARRPSAYSAPPSPSACPGGLTVDLPPVLLPALFDAASPTSSTPSVTSKSTSRSSSVSTRASFFSDSFSPVRVHSVALRPVLTTLAVQLNQILHFLQRRQPVVARVAVSRILKEFRAVSQLPHPGFMREMLVEAEQFLPRDARCARIVLDEAKEYLDMLSFDVARGKHVFPSSPAHDRKARLALRMQQWTSSSSGSKTPATAAADSHVLRDLRYKSACLNPCYRDLLFASMWTLHKHE